MGDEQRNLFIALGLILAIILGYEFFFLRPAQEAREAERQEALEAAGSIGQPLPGEGLLVRKCRTMVARATVAGATVARARI